MTTSPRKMGDFNGHRPPFFSASCMIIYRVLVRYRGHQKRPGTFPGLFCFMFCLVFIVSFARQNLQHAVADPIYQSVCLIDPSAPEATQFFFQRLWFAEAIKAPSLDILQQEIDASQRFLVLCLPIQISFLILLS